MKRSILYIILIMFLIPLNELNAQRSFGSRIFTGGNLGLQFGDVTLVDISPILGYRLTEEIDIGLTFTYKYYKIKDYFKYGNNQYYDFTTNIFGGGVFGRYYITQNLFAHVEVEYLNFSIDKYTSYNNGLIIGKENIDVTSVFVGGGYKQEMGSNAFFTMMLLYNINESKYSPYSNPVIRVGFGIGL